MLLQLTTLPQIPRPNRVVKTARPKLSAVVRDVDTARAVRVTLELPAIRVRSRTNVYRRVPPRNASHKSGVKSAFLPPHKGLVVQVPNGDVPVAAAREADFGVGADGQGVARRR